MLRFIFDKGKVKMAKIIVIGAPWPYVEERCKHCIFLEKSQPMPNGEVWVACDYGGTCFVTGEVIYPTLLERNKL